MAERPPVGSGRVCRSGQESPISGEEEEEEEDLMIGHEERSIPINSVCVYVYVYVCV